jgi:hypothetical protein
LANSGHSIIGCHYAGNNAAVVLVGILNKREYHILEDWYQSGSVGFDSIIYQCSKFFHQQINKSNQKVEIFINCLGSLEMVLTEALQAYPNPVKIVSVEKEESFTLVSSLIAEDRLSLAPQIFGLEKELRSFDVSATYPNHRVQALLNAVGQAEFNRITVPKRYHSVSGHVKRRGSSCPAVFYDGWDD